MAAVDVSAMADATWMLALSAMAMASLKAWRRLPAEGWVPLQWGPEGAPTIVARRDLAVLFTPVAAAVGGLLLAAGERLSSDPRPELTLMRVAAPLFLVFAHRAHLQAAVESVVAEADA